MGGKNKKPQLRRCAFCQKPGHNKSTCPLFLSSQKTKHSSPLVKFFVHHTTGNTSPSPHLINLKNTKSEFWDKVETSKPRESAMPLYHFYHNLKTSAKIPTPELKIDLSEEAEVEDENEPVFLQINQLITGSKFFHKNFPGSQKRF